MARLSGGLDVLRRRADFVAASTDGVKIGGPIVGLHMRDRSDAGETPRVGFTVTKRVGGAVERNRMKRRLRAAARLALDGSAKPGCDYVLIARRAVLDVGFDRLRRDVAEAAKRAHGRSAGAARPPAAGQTDPAAGPRPESGR